MDKLQQFAQKLEKKAPLKLTDDEKKILEEIEAQHDGACSMPLSVTWSNCCDAASYLFH